MRRSSLPTQRRPSGAFPQGMRAAFARRIGWLLCLVLLLPCAQTAAIWHTLSHAAVSADTEPEGKSAAHLAHCDQCLCATPLSGGGLPAAAHAEPATEARHAAPQAGIPPCRHTEFAAAYLSRAPPAVSL